MLIFYKCNNLLMMFARKIKSGQKIDILKKREIGKDKSFSHSKSQKEELKMDGFFERYGRMIVVAVAICFVLLFLTPMRNVVGSSINGFAGNFANKVGESLGTVKMPDAGIVQSGSILKIEGSEYIVLEKRENNQALVMTTSSIGVRKFHSSYDWNTNLRTDGQNANTYEGCEIDNYLENTWYWGLPSTMRAAIQSTSIKQASYATDSDSDSKQEIGPNGQVYNTISRHVFLPSVSEIGNVVDLKNPDKVKALTNGSSFWTRDSSQKYAYYAEYIYDYYGRVSGNPVGIGLDMHPTFVVDLSQIDYTVEGTTNYK